MTNVTIHVLLLSYVGFNYQKNSTYDSIKRDIESNGYFGEDTAEVLKELQSVVQVLQECEIL